MGWISAVRRSTWIRHSGASAAPRCLEIGFGAGEVIGSLAETNPHIDYLGIEVHRSGVGRLLLRAEQANLGNVRVVCHDAVEVLSAPPYKDDRSTRSWCSFPIPGTKSAIISAA